MSAPIMDRFWPKAVRDPDTECWEWNASRRPGGYGSLAPPGGNKQGSPPPMLAHRVAYENIVGPIPEGLSLDHLCRNPGCVNPAHLEPVTHRVNVLRGISPMSANARKTHCKYGHPLSGENLYRRPDGGGRQCRACSAERERKRERRAEESVDAE